MHACLAKADFVSFCHLKILSESAQLQTIILEAGKQKENDYASFTIKEWIKSDLWHCSHHSVLSGWS